MKFLQPRAVAVLASIALLATAVAGIPAALAATGGPTVVLSSTTASTTNASSIPVTVTFSESVTGFALSGVQATNATTTGLSGSGAVYSFNLVPTADGPVTVLVNADVATATAAPNKGNQVSNTLTFTVDRTAPSIGSVVVTPAQTSAMITWTTNEAATGQVSYGTTSSYSASTTLVSSLNTSHTATLTGLTASTLYHFRITSMDGLGNTGTTSDATFSTTAASSSAPVITGVNATATGTSTAQVTWNTDSAATSQVFYGTSTSYGLASALTSATSTAHSVALSGLTEATLYHYEVVSTNAAGTATSTDQIFATNSTASSTPLAVTGVDAIKSTATADGTFTDGFSWMLHLTVPTNETNFQMKFADFTTPSSSSTIPIANDVRYSSVESSNASTTASAILETNNDYGAALQLTGDTSTSTVGRQIDVLVEAAVPSGTATGVYSTLFGARSTP